MTGELEAYFDRLWPLNRSLTGNGNRDTLAILSEIADINIHETASGTECFDWKVPPEWNVREAWIKDASGNKIVDFAANNLHLLGYSESFSGTLPFEELKSHLYTKPEIPDVIPYLTSYYSRRWGFCISQNQLDSLDKDANYQVHINTEFMDSGSMTWGEAIIPGLSKKEIFFSTYICHPSMASDVLSGMLATAFLYRMVKKAGNNYYTYRFLFIPETIGSINYLSQFGDNLINNMLAGYVLTCLGDNGQFTFKKSRHGNTPAENIALRTLKNLEIPVKVEDFWPGGSDERQYCSPAFNLPVASLMRSRYEKYPQYHTSADNKHYISFEALRQSIEVYFAIILQFENTRFIQSNNPNCEPLLGKRGLYPTLGAQEKYPDYIDAMMWLLNSADGTCDLQGLAEKTGFSVTMLSEIQAKLMAEGLIFEV